MYSIISELDAESSHLVKKLWARLGESCGLRGIYQFPTPHFTWFVTDEIDLLNARAIIDDLSNRMKEFRTYAFGLGLFSGSRPVLYSPVVKSQAMIDIHKIVWSELQSCTDCAHEYYAPRFWLPHITLAINDLIQENLSFILESIAFETFSLTMTIDNLIIVAQSDNPANNVLYQYRFSETGGES